jgi:hypothetical protein
MGDPGMTDDTRLAPADVSGEFGAIKFEGGRYGRPGLPVFAMAELQRYAKLVSSVAHSLYLEQNPGRKRVPQGFAEAFDLRLMRVDQGSVVPVLERTTSESTAEGFTEAYDNARDLVDETFRKIAESGQIPGKFPANALAALAQFGRSLRDDERIVLGRDEHRRAVVNQRVRERLGRLANLDTIEVEQILIGRITGLRSEPGHGFDLTLVWPEKRRIEGTFTDAVMFDLLEEFMGYSRHAPLCSISALTQQRTNGDISITDVLTVEPALPPDWASRAAELADIRHGWLESTTPAPSTEVIDTLEALLARCVDALLPRPLMFPSGEGGIQLEWREATANVEVEILNSRTIEAAWFEPDGDAGEEKTFLFTDVDPIVQFIAGTLR